MMHSIAQLAVFGNGLFGLRLGTMVGRFVIGDFLRVIVRVYHILPCNKAKHQHPGEDYMGCVFFQVSKAFYSLGQK